MPHNNLNLYSIMKSTFPGVPPTINDVKSAEEARQVLIREAKRLKSMLESCKYHAMALQSLTQQVSGAIRSDDIVVEADWIITNHQFTRCVNSIERNTALVSSLTENSAITVPLTD